MFKTVIFDLDGTILNTIDDLADASNFACRQLGWPEYTVAQYKKLVGRGLINLIRDMAPAGSGEVELDAALQAFSVYYADHSLDKTAPYPGIPELLAAAKAAGVQLAVYSNKDDAFCGDIVEHFFPGVFDVVRGKLPGVPVKPDPAGLGALMERLGAQRETTLYVGDSNVDMETARNGGLTSCGVTWGFRDREELQGAGAVHVADEPAQLQKLILGE